MTKGAPDRQAKQGQLIAIVIVAAMLIWMGAQFLGAQGMIPVRFMFLVDFAALGALAWALITSFGIWRSRQRNED